MPRCGNQICFISSDNFNDLAVVYVQKNVLSRIYDMHDLKRPLGLLSSLDSNLGRGVGYEPSIWLKSSQLQVLLHTNLTIAIYTLT